MNRPTLLQKSFSLALLCLLASAPAHSYDGKTYIAINAGLAKLEQSVGGGYELTEDSDEAYELTVGWDIAERWSIELNWSDLGTFEYERARPTPDSEDISLVAARFNTLYYLFGSQGSTGVSERLGFNVFAKLGIGRTDERGFFDTDQLAHDFTDTFLSYGIGAELALNPYTYFRFQLQGYDDYLAFGSAAIMWRWGRARR